MAITAPMKVCSFETGERMSIRENDVHASNQSISRRWQSDAQTMSVSDVFPEKYHWSMNESERDARMPFLWIVSFSSQVSLRNSHLI
jgi:hypothetical protein